MLLRRDSKETVITVGLRASAKEMAWVTGNSGRTPHSWSHVPHQNQFPGLGFDERKQPGLTAGLLWWVNPTEGDAISSNWAKGP